MQYFIFVVPPLLSSCLEVSRRGHISGCLSHGQSAVVARGLAVLLVSAGRVNRATHVVAGSLCVHSHLVVVGADGRSETVLLVARAGRGQEIDDE
jgi:translation initiation factor 6 (eIF-6)